MKTTRAPFVLLLLVAVVEAHEGRNRATVAVARISSAHYGSLCTPIIAVCDPRFECIDNKCVCPSVKHQVYDKESATCRSLVGGPCSIGSDAGGGSARVCVPNAICTNKGYYEACECGANYVENADGGCSLGVGSECSGAAGSTTTSTDSTCDASLICRNGRCDCADELEVYDFIKKKCRGVVGASCDPSEADYCVEKAACRVANEKLRGRCSCVNAWDEWSDRFCERFEDVAVHDPYGAGPRYQTTEDPRQRLRQGASTTPSPAVPNFGGRYYRRRGGSSTPPPTATTRQYGHGGWNRERTTTTTTPRPQSFTAPTPSSGSGPSFNLRQSATRPSWAAGGGGSYPSATPAAPAVSHLPTFGGAGGEYIPENCPKQEISDCIYEDCKLTGCTEGKICCPKPCGGSWCVRGIR